MPAPNAAISSSEQMRSILILMRIASGIGLAGLLLAQSFPPVGSSVHDQDYDVTWSSAAQKSSGGWSLVYSLHNTHDGHVRILWKDSAGTEIYSGWLERTPAPVEVCTTQIGALAPAPAWESWIDIGKLTPKKTGLYQPPTMQAGRVESRTVLGILLNGVVRLIRVSASSESSNGQIRYILGAERAEWLGSVRFSWQAADSSDFRIGLSKRGAALIQLDKEALSIDISAKSARIRNGSLTVWNLEGVRLGSVFAPALVE